MTYGLSTTGKLDAVSQQIAQSNLPDAAKTMTAEIAANLAGEGDDKLISVSVSGHADEKSFSGSFNISALTEVAETEQSETKAA